MPPDPRPPTDGCELCEAAPMTERYHSDDRCWIAECESCSVPMVVWRTHSPTPPAEDRAAMLGVLTATVERLGLDADHIWIDEHMRTIPDHYHAHARRRPSW